MRPILSPCSLAELHMVEHQLGRSRFIAKIADEQDIKVQAFLPDGQQSLELDILFVGDFGDESGASQLMFDHLRSAKEQGLRIGLMHFPSLLHADAIDKSFSTELLEAFAEGRLHRVEVTDGSGPRSSTSTIRRHSNTAASSAAATRPARWKSGPANRRIATRLMNISTTSERSSGT